MTTWFDLIFNFL